MENSKEENVYDRVISVDIFRVKVGRQVGKLVVLKLGGQRDTHEFEKHEHMVGSLDSNSG